MHVCDQWNPSLPFGDYIMDRWEKALNLGFGEGTSIYDSALLMGDMAVGRNTWIGSFTVLDGSGGLVIGDHCSISAGGVGGGKINTHDTVILAVSDGVRPPDLTAARIGNRCYIGSNEVISKRVTIDEGCVIVINSFVNIDVPTEMEARGTPARVIN